jgi:leader peptidase (prepilin peptidase)/N-methyltransferase
VTALLLAIAGVLGLAIGSFLNVVVYRVPAGKSIANPPSACPNCHAAIRRRDNVPVLSWLLLRGRCRDCGNPISVRYPLVELGTSLAFIGVTLVFGRDLLSAGSPAEVVHDLAVLLAYLYLAAISIALTLIDLDTHRLPNVIVLPSYLVLAALFVIASVATLDFSHLLGAGIGMAALYAGYWVMRFAYPSGMGGGDVKLSGVLGAALGWLGLGQTLVGAFAAFLLGGLFSIALIIARRANRKSGVPFGPWMLAGAWVGIVAGDGIFKGYLVFVGLA